MPRLTAEIKYLTRCMVRYKNELLNPISLNTRQAELLNAISKNSGASQDELADLLLMSKSSAARHLAVLEEKSLICRRQDDKDRRMLRLELTGQGAALLPQIRAVDQAWSDFVTADLSDAELAHLEDLLEGVLRRAKSYLKGGTLP